MEISTVAYTQGNPLLWDGGDVPNRKGVFGNRQG
jgi:hypothetical protein